MSLEFETLRRANALDLSPEKSSQRDDGFAQPSFAPPAAPFGSVKIISSAPLQEFTLSEGERSDFSAPTLLNNVPGINIIEQAAIIGFNRVPPDHNGAVGPDHVISVINHVMQIYDKNGNLQSTTTLESLFGVVPVPTALPVDPNLFWDADAERFVFVSFEVTGFDNNTNTANDQVRLNVAVSQTSDPNDGWHVGSINAATVINGINTWSDYPGVGVDGSAIYITANMFPFDGTAGFQGNRLWIVDKGEGSGGLYDGGVLSFSVHDPIASATDISGFGVQAATLMPARYASESPGDGIYLVSMSGISSGANELAQFIRIDNPLTTPTFTAQSISLGDISNENLNFLPQATQPGTAQALASGDSRVFGGGAVWFEDKIYFTSSVAPKSGPDAGQSTTHWVEVDASNPNALSVIQQGNIGGEDIAPGTHTFQSSIGVNKDGTLLINFSASGPTVFPGAYYALRGEGDPVGTFGPAQTLEEGVDFYFRNRAGEGISSQTRNRWGDFSGVAVDPTDETTFWFFNMFAETRGSPNAQGQDGIWRVVTGSARATIENFEYLAGNAAEAFYGGLGNDGLRILAAPGQIADVTLTPGGDGEVHGDITGGVAGDVEAHFIEAIAFEGDTGADTFSVEGNYDGVGFVLDAVLADGGNGNDNLSAALLNSFLGVNFAGGQGDDTIIGSIAADHLNGGTQDDMIEGLTSGDMILGVEGADTLFGGAGDDTLLGDVGTDTLSGGDGADSLNGGPGVDELFGGNGADTLVGAVSNDVLSGNNGADELFGGGGNDTLFGGAQGDTLAGGDNADQLNGNNGNDALFGGSGNDTLDAGEGADTATGFTGDDVVSGGSGADTIYGGEGDDTLNGGDQSDFLGGNAGADSLDGGSGNDTADAGFDDDFVTGADGNDSISGNTGTDTVNGGIGDDTVIGGDGNDELLGDTGNDLLFGGQGADTLTGGDDDDLLAGNDGADTLQGDGGADTMNGGAGDDSINGGDGADILLGTTGDDTLEGGAGDDTMNGGNDNDLFVFAPGSGLDQIDGFVAGATAEDVIQLSGFGAGLDDFADVLAAVNDDGFGNVVIDLNGVDMITIIGVVEADLATEDFLFS